MSNQKIWLAVTSVIPLYYPGGWWTFPKRMCKEILHESYGRYVWPSLADDPPEQTWAVGAFVASALRGMPGMDPAQVIVQPTRGNSKKFEASLEGMKREILRSLWREFQSSRPQPRQSISPLLPEDQLVIKASTEFREVGTFVANS
ncbi:MAG: hypothetical protein ABFD89_01995 [Bryobacteraceae bacterium]